VTQREGNLQAPTRHPLEWRDAEFYDEAALERAVERLLATSEVELERMGTTARTWFEDNDRAFRARIAEAVRALVT